MYGLVVIGFPQSLSEFFEQSQRKRIALVWAIQCQTSPSFFDFVLDVFVGFSVWHNHLPGFVGQYSDSRKFLRRRRVEP